MLHPLIFIADDMERCLIDCALVPPMKSVREPYVEAVVLEVITRM